MEIYVKTAKGVGKNKSEDRVLVGHSILNEISLMLNIKDGVVAIADGVGGNNAGDVAAVTVCEEVSNLEEISIGAFKYVNNQLLEKSFSNNRFTGMATTFSGVLCKNGFPIDYFHVGNTRIYSIQAGMYLKQLTIDDTVVERLLTTGVLSEEEAENYSGRNEITACFGGGKKDLLTITLKPFCGNVPSQLLLTSDGVHEYLTIDDMENVICDCDGNWEALVSAMVSMAVENGSEDDCSIVLINF